MPIEITLDIARIHGYRLASIISIVGSLVSFTNDSGLTEVAILGMQMVRIKIPHSRAIFVVKHPYPFVVCFD